MAGEARPGPEVFDAYVQALRCVLRAEAWGAPDADPDAAERAVVALLGAVDDVDDVRRVAAALAWMVTAVIAAGGHQAVLRPVLERLLIEATYAGPGMP